jgi:hypothetical protein
VLHYVYNKIIKVAKYSVQVDLAILVITTQMFQASILKLMGLGFLALLFAAAVVVLVNQSDITVQCSKASEQCVSSCFDDEDGLIGLNDSVDSDSVGPNSFLLGCLKECPANSDVCLSEEQIKEIEEIRKWEEDFKVIEKYLVHNPKNPRLIIFDGQKAKADNISEDLINLGEGIQNASLAYSKTIGTTARFNPTYGNWCGLKHGGGKPIDTLDSLCMKHDKCYDKKGYFACSCDRALIRGIIANATKFKKVKEYAAAYAILAYFTIAPCNPFA